MLFFSPIMLLSNSQETYTNYAEDYARFFCATKCPFLTITNTYSTFRAKSEGLGDSSLLNNEATRTSTSWPGSWESSGSLPELSTAAGHYCY